MPVTVFWMIVVEEMFTTVDWLCWESRVRVLPLILERVPLVITPGLAAAPVDPVDRIGALALGWAVEDSDGIGVATAELGCTAGVAGCTVVAAGAEAQAAIVIIRAVVAAVVAIKGQKSFRLAVISVYLHF